MPARQNGGMSRAFVKEEAGERWTPPPPQREYRLVWTGGDAPETLRETDDLLDALHWLGARERAGFELRDRAGALLATNAA